MDVATATQILSLFDRLCSAPASPDLRDQFLRVEQKQRLPALLTSQGALSPNGRKFRDRLQKLLKAQKDVDSFTTDEVRHSSGYALVIGSAHLDVYGDYREDQRENKDKVGRITYSVGGAAFNIAANLASQNVPVSLYTCLAKDSLATDSIMRQCTACGIDRRFIALTEGRDEVGEVGFVAHRYEGDLESAVTATLIDKIELDESSLKIAIAGCKFLVIECNLSESQIFLITRLAYQAKKTVIAGGVSDAKAKRILSAHKPADSAFGLELFMLNELEAKRTFMEGRARWTAGFLCRKARCRTVVVTRGSYGFSTFHHDGTSKKFPARSIKQFISVSGAGDVLLAAACKCYFHSETLQWDKIAKEAAEMFVRVSETKTASVVSMTAFQEASKGSPTSDVKGKGNEFAKKLKKLCDEEQLVHGPGYISVTKHGTNYTLTKMQARCIQFLWEKYDQGTPDVTASSILEEIGSSASDDDRRNESKALYENIWKRVPGTWRALVMTGRAKGTYRLNVEKNHPQGSK